MEKHRISAGIILYKPKLERLLQNIEKIKDSVESIFVYNNGTEEHILEVLKSNKKLIILGDGNNIGIAAAMNRIMEAAIKDGKEWLVTFDQDSVSDNNLIDEYKKVISMNFAKVAILCPQVIDERRKYITAEIGDEIENVSRCITSASCTNLTAWQEVGGFDEFLFIDLVDNDFCKRLNLYRWSILKLHSVILNQEFGDITIKDDKTVDRIMRISGFLKNKLSLNYFADNVGKLTYRKKVSPMRVYYTNRNVIYLNQKYKKYGGIGYDCYKCRSYLGFQICFNLASFVRGKEKVKIFKAIVVGICDGLKSKRDCKEFDAGGSTY